MKTLLLIVNAAIATLALTIALDGKLPLNTPGGQLSAGRTHGFGFLAEAIAQLLLFQFRSLFVVL